VAGPDRLRELDSLRGIAATAVVLYHYLHHYGNLYGHPFAAPRVFALGELGVPLFFMVSGFVIFWTLRKTRRPLDFVVSRFSRLYPVYWVALATTLCVVGLFGLPGREATLRDAALNLLMFHEALRVPHVDGVYWTLTVELTFYAWMFLLLRAGQLQHVERWLLLALAIGATIVAFDDGSTLSKAIAKLFIARHAPYFAAGICFYRLWRREAVPSTWVVLALALLMNWLLLPVERALVVSGFFVLFWLMARGRLGWLGRQPLMFLGSVSYALYLTHQNIGYVLMRALYAHGSPAWLTLGFALACSVLLAWLLTRCVEQPALAGLRRAYALHQQRRAGAVAVMSAQPKRDAA